MRFELWQVGGSLRDEILGVKSKDLDFSVEIIHEDFLCSAQVGFVLMRQHLLDNDYQIFEERPEFGTIRAHFPRDHEQYGKTTADFVLCRKEGPYTDGRRPDYVMIGTIEDDLARRDFTVNALARRLSDGHMLDLFGGVEDAHSHLLRCVGFARDRFTEDALRALRALRFSITKDFHIDKSILNTLQSTWLPPLVKDVSVERRVDELTKMFKYDTLRTMEILDHWITPELRDAIFHGGIRLIPSLRQR